MGGLRRSEVSALEWRDVSDARDSDGVLLTVRTSKTNQEGDAADVRYLKNGAAKAIRTLRAADADVAPTDRVIGLSPLQIQRRFTAAARAAGIEARVTAHSGRVGLASELTARGASSVYASEKLIQKCHSDTIVPLLPSLNTSTSGGLPRPGPPPS